MALKINKKFLEKSFQYFIYASAFRSSAPLGCLHQNGKNVWEVGNPIRTQASNKYNKYTSLTSWSRANIVSQFVNIDFLLVNLYYNSWQPNSSRHNPRRESAYYPGVR